MKPEQFYLHIVDADDETTFRFNAEPDRPNRHQVVRTLAHAGLLPADRTLVSRLCELINTANFGIQLVTGMSFEEGKEVFRIDAQLKITTFTYQKAKGGLVQQDVASVMDFVNLATEGNGLLGNRIVPDSLRMVQLTSPNGVTKLYNLPFALDWIESVYRTILDANRNANFTAHEYLLAQTIVGMANSVLKSEVGLHANVHLALERQKQVTEYIIENYV